MADDMGERTEDPTAKRREEARSEGNVAKSQDLTSAMMLVVASVVVMLIMFGSMRDYAAVLANVLDGDTISDPIKPGEVIVAVRYVVAAGLRIAVPVLGAMFLIAAVAQFFQVGWLFSLKVLEPKLSKLNPISGFKRIFGITMLVKVGMDSVKVLAVGPVAALTVYQYADEILLLPHLAPLQIVTRVQWMMFDLALRLLALLLLLGILDYIYQKWKNKEDLKMTKQQVKDELRASEGDPETKRRRAKIQQQVAMQRISAAVPRADVIVTNPDHVSVAIQYDAEQMHAPTVIAKGADFLALRIRQIALIRNIPIVQRPPLARALYTQVEVGQEIPPDFYNAVAEVLAYVYRLDGRMAG